MNDDMTWNELLKLAFLVALSIGAMWGPMALMDWLDRKRRR